MNFVRRTGNLFRSAPPVINRLFNQGRTLASQASPILGRIANGLAVASEYGNKIANHEGLRSINSPTLQSGLNTLSTASQLADRGSGLSNNLANFTNESSYNKGSHEANLTNALQRAKDIKQEASVIFKH